MAQLKSRQIVAVLSLSAALFLLPAAECRAAQSRAFGESDLMARLESRIASIWYSMVSLVTEARSGDAGAAIDGNGNG